MEICERLSSSKRHTRKQVAMYPTSRKLPEKLARLVPVHTRLRVLSRQPHASTQQKSARTAAGRLPSLENLGGWPAPRKLWHPSERTIFVLVPRLPQHQPSTPKNTSKRGPASRKLWHPSRERNYVSLLPIPPHQPSTPKQRSPLERNDLS